MVTHGAPQQSRLLSTSVALLFRPPTLDSSHAELPPLPRRRAAQEQSKSTQTSLLSTAIEANRWDRPSVLLSLQNWVMKIC